MSGNTSPRQAARPSVGNPSPTTVVTGVTGFIGAELSEALCANGGMVVGIDRRDESSADALVCERLARLRRYPTFSFAGVDLRDASALEEALPTGSGFTVVHLAARAGVRHADTEETIQCNVIATESLLEVLRYRLPRQLLFSSSSSVYGNSAPLPFREGQELGTPASLYAQTKVVGELRVRAFAHQTGVPATTLRLFNVYGPRMRHDLAVPIFARSILAGTPADLSNNGQVRRDMTFVGDVVTTVSRLLRLPPVKHETLNVGTGRSVLLADVLDLLEAYMGKRMRRRVTKPHPSDLPATLADVSSLRARLGRSPETAVEDGLRKFADWFLSRDVRTVLAGSADQQAASRASAE